MRESFTSTSRGGLRRDLLPMRLYQLAKRWFWDPAAIDFTQDQVHWQQLSPPEQSVIKRMAAGFVGGEEAVTLDLLPLLHTIATEGRIEEEMYLTTFLLEEAKHVEFFDRFLKGVGIDEDLHRFHAGHYHDLFYRELPQAMNRLYTDPSPTVQVEAAVTYHLVVEGMLAETGYHFYFQALKAGGLMPGLVAGIERIKNDESRHIAWGLYYLSRLIAADPTLLKTAQARAWALLPLALGVVKDSFVSYGPQVPFGQTEEGFVSFATNQFQRRMAALERSAGLSLEQLTEQIGAEFPAE